MRVCLVLRHLHLSVIVTLKEVGRVHAYSPMCVAVCVCVCTGVA